MKPLKRLRIRNLMGGVLLAGVALWGTARVSAADPLPTVELQLRDRLRTTLLQLRTAESERATLQAAQAQWADEKSKLTERAEAPTKQINANKLTAQVVDTLKSQAAQQEKEIAQLKGAVESGRQAAELARTQAVERAKLTEEVINGMERLVVDRQAKNLGLYKLASEILQRYEKFGLGDALTAREPFIGITRVKLQNFVQDYQDKLLADRVTLTEKDVAAYRDKLRLESNSPGSSPTSK